VHLGLIGSGNITRTHALAATAAGFTVAAVLGRTLDGATRLCEERGGTPYDSLVRFLAHPGLSSVAIGTPSGLHAEHGIAAARRGLHVLVEKPIDISVDRADALIDAAERAGVQLAVCFQDRFAPDVCVVKDLIERGALGRLLLVDARVPWYRPPSYYASSNWRGTWALDGGGALMNQGIHTLDLLLWLLGEVARVRGSASTLRHAIEVEDTAQALLEFQSGARGTLSVTTAAFPGYPRSVTITGTAGTVTLEGDALVAADLEGGTPPGLAVRQRAADDGRASTPAVSDISGHQALFADFARAIRTGARPRCDGRDGRRSVALVRAVYDSSASGLPVDPAGAGPLSGVSRP
jgi:predicted dehydrogenase